MPKRPARPERSETIPENPGSRDLPRICPNCQDVLARCVEVRSRSVARSLSILAGGWLSVVVILSLLFVSDTAAERFAGLAAIGLIVLWFARTRYRSIVDSQKNERRYFCRRCGGSFGEKDVETTEPEPER